MSTDPLPLQSLEPNSLLSGKEMVEAAQEIMCDVEQDVPYSKLNTSGNTASVPFTFRGVGPQQSGIVTSGLQIFVYVYMCTQHSVLQSVTGDSALSFRSKIKRTSVKTMPFLHPFV